MKREFSEENFESPWSINYGDSVVYISKLTKLCIVRVCVFFAYQLHLDKKF